MRRGVAAGGGTVVAAVAAYTWDSCGTRYDRLVTQSLTFTATPGMTAGAQGTIVTKVRFAAQRAVRAWMRVPRACAPVSCRASLTCTFPWSLARGKFACTSSARRTQYTTPLVI